MLTTQFSLSLKGFTRTLAVISLMAIALPSHGSNRFSSPNSYILERATSQLSTSSVTLEPPNDDIPKDTVGDVGS